MKKIGIDARLYFQTGVGVYLRNLLYYLSHQSEEEIKFYIYLLDEDFIKVNFDSKYFIKRSVKSKWHSFEEQIEFLNILNKDKLDLVHFTYFSYPILYRKKFIATVHDATPLEFKTGRASTKNSLLYYLKHLVFKQVLNSQVKNSSIIITPSKTVKKQLINIYGKQYEKKINPIYEGIDYELLQVKENELLYKNIKKPFFLYVGNFYPHKNIEKLIIAFSTLKKDIQLILVGPDDFFTHRLNKLINKLNLQKKVIFYHNVNNENKVYLYKNAVALVSPSLSEGFGLPLIEANYFSCPVIASNIEVFKEILNNQYLSFDPYSIEDIADKLIFFIKERSKLDFRKINIKYSFEEMAIQTLNIYRRLIF